MLSKSHFGGQLLVKVSMLTIIPRIECHKHRKQPSSGVLRKSCSENMQQIYSRTLTPKCDFNKAACNFNEITFRHGCSPVNLLYIFRTPFTKGLWASASEIFKLWELNFHSFKEEQIYVFFEVMQKHLAIDYTTKIELLRFLGFSYGHPCDSRSLEKIK